MFLLNDYSVTWKNVKIYLAPSFHLPPRSNKPPVKNYPQGGGIYFEHFKKYCPNYIVIYIFSFWDTFRELETFGNLYMLLFKTPIVLYE
jgi:hypothetical protein